MNVTETETEEEESEEVTYCEGCDAEVEAKDAVWLEPDRWSCPEHAHGLYCPSCATTCADCGNRTHADQTYTTRSRETVCGDCVDSHYACCEGCGDIVHLDDSRHNEYDCATYCSSCYLEERGGEDQGPVPMFVCGNCKTPNDHLHLLTERFLCDCAAEGAGPDFVVLGRPLQTTERKELVNA